MLTDPFLPFLPGELQLGQAGTAIEDLGHRVAAPVSARISSNAHNPHNLPIVVAGRAGGAFAPGRHLAYGKNMPLANLYRSMMSALGVPTDHFADSTGELAGLGDSVFQGAV